MAEHDWDNTRYVCKRCQMTATQLKKRGDWTWCDVEPVHLQKHWRELAREMGYTFSAETTVTVRPLTEAEPQADGATAPNTEHEMTVHGGDYCSRCGQSAQLIRERGWDCHFMPAKPPGKAPEHVPSIGHAMRQTARPVTLCGALLRYRGRGE